MENDDGILLEIEKVVFRRMVFVDVLVNFFQEIGDEEVLEGERDSGEEYDDSNEILSVVILK